MACGPMDFPKICQLRHGQKIQMWLTSSQGTRTYQPEHTNRYGYQLVWYALQCICQENVCCRIWALILLVKAFCPCELLQLR
jgi:hypothetical protein